MHQNIVDLEPLMSELVLEKT